jgi:tetratricopeptide (TPR) repeat protein
MVLYRLGRLKEAIKVLKKALPLAENPVLLDHLGDIYWLLDKKEKALKIWNRSIAASSNILFIQRLQKKIKTGMTCDIVFE